MSDLIDALTMAITGRPPINESSDVADIIHELVKAAGSAKAAGALFGVKDTTFYRWRNHVEGRDKGVKQDPLKNHSKRELISGLRRAQLPKAKERRLKTRQDDLAITGTMTVSNDKGVRQTIHLRRGGDVGRLGVPMPNEVAAKIIDLWLDGNDSACDEELRDAVDKYYVAGMEIDDTESIELE